MKTQEEGDDKRWRTMKKKLERDEVFYTFNFKFIFFNGNNLQG